MWNIEHLVITNANEENPPSLWSQYTGLYRKIESSDWFKENNINADDMSWFYDALKDTQCNSWNQPDEETRWIICEFFEIYSKYKNLDYKMWCIYGCSEDLIASLHFKSGVFLSGQSSRYTFQLDYMWVLSYRSR